MALFSRKSPKADSTSMIYCLLCTQRRGDRPTVSFPTCHHTFCATCLFEHHFKQLGCAQSTPLPSKSTYKLENFDVRCPNCPSPQPTKGDDLIKEVPYGHKVRHLMDAVDITKVKKSDKQCECAKKKLRSDAVRKLCLECKKLMCEQCFVQHEKDFGLSTGSPDAAQHIVVRHHQHEIQLLCAKHKKALGYHCKECGKLACDTCMTDRRAHFDHSVDLFKTVSRKHHEASIGIRDRIQRVISEKTKRKQDVSELMKLQEREQAKTQQDIVRHTDWLMKTLEAASKAMLDELNKFAEGMKTLYQNHTQYLDYTIHHLNRLQWFIQEMCQPGMEPIILLHSEELLQHIHNLEADSRTKGKEQLAMQDFYRAPRFELNVQLHNFQIKKIGDLQFCEMTGVDLPQSVAPTTLPTAVFLCETSPTQGGNHAGGLLFTSGGALLVTEYHQSQIVKYELPATIKDPEPVRDPRNNFFPHKMASDGMFLYVTDDSQKCVKGFDRQGRLTMRSSHTFSSPSGIAVSNDNKLLIVSDILDHNITVLKVTGGRFVRNFCKKGSKQSELDVPEFIMVDGDNNILVSDRNNHRVCVFRIDGKFIREFGTPGSGPGQLQTPMGLCGDEYGNILLVDCNNYRICRFNSRGEYIDIVLTFDRGAAVPYAIAISKKTGAIAISDKSLSTIRVYNVYNYE